MGLFEGMNSKKKSTAVDTVDKQRSPKSGCLEDAEEMAQMVSDGLEQENYSEMNRKLTEIAQKVDREQYIFECPEAVGKLFPAIGCILLTIAYAYFFLIGSATSFLSHEYVARGIVIAVISAAVVYINVSLILRAVSAIRYQMRFNSYEELIGCRSYELVGELALHAKQNEATVIKDLQKAVKEKLIPQGHFNRDDLVFMVSDKVYNRYLEKPEVYDRYFKKMLEDRQRVKSRTKRVQEIMEAGDMHIAKIQDYRKLIKDKVVGRKIERMENIVSMIFEEIDANPKQAKSLGVFLNYYLPTTEKLLDAYVAIGEKPVSRKNAPNEKKEIEEALNIIVDAFEGILEKLYEEREMDIASDIAAMELTMKQEGLPV
jgi:hypothetical protein